MAPRGFVAYRWPMFLPASRRLLMLTRRGQASPVRWRAATVAASAALLVFAAAAPVDAATRKRAVKRVIAPKVVPLPPSTAPAPQPLPPTTAAVVTIPPTTVPSVALSLTSDFPRRLAAPGGSAVFVLTATSRSIEPTTFSISGLPPGVRAVLATNPTTSKTTMTLTTTIGVTPGGYQPFLVTAIGGGASATLTLELVVDTTVASAMTTTMPSAPLAFTQSAETLLAGPISAGGGNFVAYRVNLIRPTGVSGVATVSVATPASGLAVGLSATTVSGSSFEVSFSAPVGTPTGFYQPAISVVIGGYTLLILFPVQVI